MTPLRWLPLLALAGALRAGAVEPPRAAPIARIEVVAGELAVSVYAHRLAGAPPPGDCWTYVTEGLAARGHKELVFTVLRARGEGVKDFPTGGLPELLRAVYDLAGKGRRVDAGGFTLLSPESAEILPGSRFRAILYARPEHIPGVSPATPHLMAVLVTLEEGVLATKTSPARVLARLGHLYRYFPTAAWSERGRAPVEAGVAETRSVARQAHVEARLSSRILKDAAGADGSGGSLLLLVEPDDGPTLRSLRSVPEDRTVSLFTTPGASSTAILTWSPGQQKLIAITAPGADGRRVDGAFIVFAPGAEEDGGAVAEDGFVMFLRPSTWQRVRAALADGRDLVIEPSGEKMGLTITWNGASTPPAP